MPKTLTKHAANPAPLLALARKQVAWRGMYKHATPAEQESQVQQQARGLAIAKSDIGQAATRIGEKLDALIEEVAAFLDKWPVDDAA